MMLRGRGILLAAAFILLAGAAATVPEPDDYRTEDYRAPTPTTLRGASVLSTDEAAVLWTSGTAVFIDVLPRAPRPAGLPPATLWRPKPRDDIPGSVWLPDTGYGALAPITQRYFEYGLNAATAGNRDRTLAFYCLRNCWMSWNAAKRALTLGYTHVAWYPDGTDGWVEAGLPLEHREPLPPPSPPE
jgi:PQQ-dependent catabolism-associated CXXCW motif protein